MNVITVKTGVCITKDYFSLHDNQDYYYKDKNRDDLIQIKDNLFAFGERWSIDYIGERTTLQQQKVEEDEKFLNL